MRIVYNPNTLFKGIDAQRRERYVSRLYHFLHHVSQQKHHLDTHTIQKFNIKKMRTTENIFKFYMDYEDGSRCLFQYEQHHPIFEDEPGIALLAITDHDDQGRIARRLDGLPIKLQEFLLLDDQTEENVDEPLVWEPVFMKHVLFQENLSEKHFLKTIELNDPKGIYELSANQNQALHQEGPVFLLGCAGSGKTLVEVSKALKLAHQNVKQSYFTFTELLKESAASLYAQYEDSKGIKGNTEFHTITRFMLKACGLNEAQYFSFERYLNWYEKENFDMRYPKLKAIGKIGLWIELRGIIKGFVGYHTHRIFTLPQLSSFLTETELKSLVLEGVLKKDKGSHSRYLIINAERFAHYKRGNHTLNRYLKDLDRSSPLIDDFAYLNVLKEEYSQLKTEERKEALRFAKDHYQPYLENKESPWFDDNDLARLMLANLETTSPHQKYDYVFIDEMQDLTEMQVLALSKLSVHPSRLYMTGDVSQTINPTFFHAGRMGVIFKHHHDNITLNRHITLNENYRNSQAVVQIVRALLDLRVKILGSYTDDIEEQSKQLERKKGVPFYIDAKNDEIISILGAWIDLPNVAVIVANEKTKHKLKRLLNITSETNLYTVSEVKGYEFEKIFLYDILSSYHDAWEHLLNQPIERKKDVVARYKFFFNLFYVAITRARDHLFMYESHPPTTLLNHLKPFFDVISNNIVDAMDLKAYQNYDETLKQAQAFFKLKEYSRARTYFLRIERKADADRALGYEYLQKGEYQQGVEMLYLNHEDREELFKYTHLKSQTLMHLLLGYQSGSLGLDVIDSVIAQESLTSMIKPYIKHPLYATLCSDALQLIRALHAHNLNNYLSKEGHHVRTTTSSL